MISLGGIGSFVASGDVVAGATGVGATAGAGLGCADTFAGIKFMLRPALAQKSITLYFMIRTSRQ